MRSSSSPCEPELHFQPPLTCWLVQFFCLYIHSMNETCNDVCMVWLIYTYMHTVTCAWQHLYVFCIFVNKLWKPCCWYDCIREFNGWPNFHIPSFNGNYCSRVRKNIYYEAWCVVCMKLNSFLRVKNWYFVIFFRQV